jgi:hypothetical protein
MSANRPRLTVLAFRTCQIKYFTDLPSMAVSGFVFVALCLLITATMWQPITYAAFGSAAVVDSILAVTIIYYLRRSRGEFES